MSAAIVQGPWNNDPDLAHAVQQRWHDLGIVVEPAESDPVVGLWRVRASKHVLSNVSVVFRPEGFTVALRQLGVLLEL